MTNSRKNGKHADSKRKAAARTKPPRKIQSIEEIPGAQLTLSELALRLIEEVQKIKQSNQHVSNRIDAIEEEVDGLILKVRGIIDNVEYEYGNAVKKKVADRLYRRIGDTLTTEDSPEIISKISTLEADIEKRLVEIRNLVEHFRKKERDLVSVLIINRFTKTVDTALGLEQP
ncbi:MAG: hypothetical protein E3J72_15020 [Planctomycetota bacterium]|nr:MAG: hypothetical protein E3J72_15020 [Planctomycetota bacterium]